MFRLQHIHKIAGEEKFCIISFWFSSKFLTKATFSEPLEGTVETAGGQDLKKVYLTTSIADISTAGQIYIVSPVAGTTTIDGADV